MFVSDFITVELPVDETQRRLLEEGGTRLWGLAVAADETVELRLRVGPAVGGLGVVGKAVRLEIGEPRTRGDRVVIALRWEGTGAFGAVFPDLDADLELAPLGPDHTQISLHGRYEPPFQSIGRGMDRLLMHRVAQASIRGFLQRLGQALVTAPAGHR